MAFFVPVLAAVGGGSALAGGLALGAAGLGVAKAYQTYKMGEVANAEAKLASKQAGDAARGREIERKRDLLKALATQNAHAGAQGVAIQGSNEAIARADIRDARNDLLADTANTRTQQRIYRARGRNAQSEARLGAVTSLLDTATGLYKAAG